MKEAGLSIERTDRLEIDGITIGHGTDREAGTGVTVILAPEGAVAAAEVRGSATGTRQFDSLVSDQHLATRCHGVVLAGGSGMGLSAADPVIRFLRSRGKGFDAGVDVVPLVPTAILFDLGFGGSNAVPGPELVEEAIGGAGAGALACGSVGAGTGATVGKAAGLEWAMKGGFGFAALRLGGESPFQVAAAVAANPFGDVHDPATGALLAGSRAPGLPPDRAGRAAAFAAHALSAERHTWEQNTTLGVILTDAALPKPALRKVCQMAFGALYRTLDPALSPYDGDLVVALSMGSRPAPVQAVGILAESALALAIARAVEEADGLGHLPAVRDLGGGVDASPRG